MQINTSKTKEMIIACLITANLPLLSTSAGSVERVTTDGLFTLALSPPKPANDYKLTC